jgi:hypothetical protein
MGRAKFTGSNSVFVINPGGPMDNKEKNAGSQSNVWLQYGKNPWIYVAAMAVLVVIIFSGFFFSKNMLSSSDQMAGLDSRVFFRTSILDHHQFPFWFNPRLGGMPTIDALFGDAFYPPSLIINTFFPVERAIGLKMILHIFLAGLFFFLFLYRGFKIAAPLAFLGGVLYMLNPEFFSHIYPGHDGKMYVIALVPLMLWRLKALADRVSLMNATLLGLGIGLALLTSQIQITYFTLWGLFFYAAFAVVVYARKKETSVALRLGLMFCLAVAIGLGIGFIQFFPSFMYVKDAFSVRGAERGFEYAASWSLHWPEFFSLWVPEFGNTLDYYWSNNPFKLNSEYAGGIVLVLSVISLVYKPKQWRFLWLGIAVFAVLYSMGAHTPVFKAAYHLVPGVKKFRACSMIMFWFSFSTVLLAALFLKDLLSGELGTLGDQRKKKWNKGLLIAMAAIGVLSLLFSIKGFVEGVLPFVSSIDTQKRQIFDANFSRNFVPMLWLWFFFAAISLLCIMGVINGKLKPGVAASIIGVLCFIDVIRDDAQFIKYADPRPYFYNEPALQKLKDEMVAAPFRVFTLPGTLSQNGEGIHGLEGVGGFHDNELRWYREFRGDQQDRNYFDQLLGFTQDGGAYLKADRIDQGNAFLNIANVRYLLARNGSQLIAIENKNALGRVSFASRYKVMDSSLIVQSLQQGGYDYRTTVALLKEPEQKASSADTDVTFAPLPLEASWQRYTPNERIVKVTAPHDGFLRISEAYYPGWNIAIDGVPTKTYRADLAWMAVNISKGEHTVTLRARSIFFKKAAWISFPIILALCLYWIGTVLLDRRKKTP